MNRKCFTSAAGDPHQYSAHSYVNVIFNCMNVIDINLF
jgi:hypothetical protein